MAATSSVKVPATRCGRTRRPELWSRCRATRRFRTASLERSAATCLCRKSAGTRMSIKCHEPRASAAPIGSSSPATDRLGNQTTNAQPSNAEKAHPAAAQERRTLLIRGRWISMTTAHATPTALFLVSLAFMSACAFADRAPELIDGRQLDFISGERRRWLTL
jgi:hypothetical protein